MKKIFKPGEYRKFYEEKVEQNENNGNRVKYYESAWKKMHRFQNKKKTITNESKEPRWYQELSVNQVNVLHTFGDRIRDDYVMCTAYHTKHAIKALGVRTFIPDDVAKHAIVVSELYPVLHLTAIKNYVMNKVARRQKCQKNTVDYPVDVRILMTSIVYIEFPNLLQKLDYCLPVPVQEKLEYIKRPKRTSIKYDSPYLEPLPEPVILTTQEKKIQRHNANVLKQRVREKLQAKEHKEQQRLDRILTEVENSTVSRMKIIYPEHPLEKMFYRPPLLIDTGDTEQKIDVHVSTSTNSGQSSASTSRDEPQPMTDVVDVTVPDGRDHSTLSGSSLHTLAETESLSHGMPPTQPPAPEQTPPSSPPSSVWDEWAERNRLPYGWLKMDHLVPDDRTGWADQSSSDDDYDWLAEKNAATTATGTQVQTMDFDVLDCEPSTTSADERTGASSGCAPKSGDGEEYEADDCCSLEQREQFWRSMDERERRVYRLFGMLGPPPPPAANTSAESLSRSAEKHDDPGEREEIGLDRKRTMLYLLPSGFVNDDDGSGSVELLSNSSGSSSSSSSSSAERPRRRRGDTDNAVTGNKMDEQLNVIRKLPLTDQLKKTLDFLSNMGDPIAGFPDLINLRHLQLWYKQRLDISRVEKPLKDKSIAVWNIPRPKLTIVSIPKI